MHLIFIFLSALSMLTLASCGPKQKITPIQQENAVQPIKEIGFEGIEDKDEESTNASEFMTDNTLTPSDDYFTQAGILIDLENDEDKNELT